MAAAAHHLRRRLQHERPGLLREPGCRPRPFERARLLCGTIGCADLSVSCGDAAGTTMLFAFGGTVLSALAVGFIVYAVGQSGARSPYAALRPALRKLATP
eukprot:4020829-Pleurochrysis_carterae.AAC.4